MLRIEDILMTLRMFQDENCDVRTVTMGIQLYDCADPDLEACCNKVQCKIHSLAGRLVREGRNISAQYGIPIVNFRIAVTPVAWWAAGHGAAGMVKIAKALDQVAQEIGVDFLGGFSAFVEKGETDADRDLIAALPEALGDTGRACAFVVVISSRAGTYIYCCLSVSQSITALAELTCSEDGF